MRMKMCVGLAVLLAVACVPGQLFAQDTSGIDSDIQMLRADIRSDKTKIMADQMQLSDSEGKAFWPIYNEYDHELSKLNDQRVALLKEYAESYNTLTDQQVQSLADRSFALQKKRIDLREKYFKKMSKALTPKSAARFVQVEDRVDMLLNLQLAANLPMVDKK
jgi:Spy/CpxP family protein refolding chaperone